MKSVVILQIAVIVVCLMALAIVANANQIGVNITKDSVGILGDYEKGLHENVDLNLDAQIQRGDTVSAIGNASIQYAPGAVGIKPFISYNKDELGSIADVGGVLNFHYKGFDVSGGASFRGSDPVSDGGLDGFDKDGNPIKYYEDDPSNTYVLPAKSNINGVFQTGFEKWGIETGLTAYVPITERDDVPVVLISRSQTSIQITDGLGLSLVVDARTYVHSDGIHIEFTPAGAAILKF